MEAAASASVEPSTSSSGGSRSYTGNVLINTRQRGNPLLKFIRNVTWEFTSEIKPDYIFGHGRCALFLSLRYHHVNPNYIHERMKELKAVGKSFVLRVLLVQVDIKDYKHLLVDVNKICFFGGYTLMMAWSAEEAAQLIEMYKIYENKSPQMLMGKREYKSDRDRFAQLLTSLKVVNKVDAENLIDTFGSLTNIVNATQEQLALVPGIGELKAKKLYDIVREPFCSTSVDTLL